MRQNLRLILVIIFILFFPFEAKGQFTKKRLIKQPIESIPVLENNGKKDSITVPLQVLGQFNYYKAF